MQREALGKWNSFPDNNSLFILTSHHTLEIHPPRNENDKQGAPETPDTLLETHQKVSAPSEPPSRRSTRPHRSVNYLDLQKGFRGEGFPSVKTSKKAETSIPHCLVMVFWKLRQGLKGGEGVSGLADAVSSAALSLFGSSVK